MSTSNRIKLTQLPVDAATLQALATNYALESFRTTLKKGEGWERIVVEYLQRKGFSARRPQCKIAPNASRGSYAKKQLDIVIDIAGTPLNIEIKARSGNPFQWSSIDIGRVSSWDAKQFSVDFVIVIDQSTGQAAVTSGDREGWLKRRNLDYCYSVPRHLFTPLEPWLDALSAGLIAP